MHEPPQRVLWRLDCLRSSGCSAGSAHTHRRYEQAAAVTPNVTQFAYDATGDRIQILDAKQRSTRYVYDALDRLREVHQEGITPALVTRFGYDARGSVTRVTDPKDQTTEYGYDTRSRLRTVTQPLGQQVQYRYDDRDRLTRIVNARGHALDHVYTPWGSLDRVLHYPDEATADLAPSPERTIGYTYDEAGNLTGTSDTDFDPNAPELYTFSYDPLNRVDRVTALYLPQGPVTLENGYDRFGNRDTLVLEDGGPPAAHTWTYDRLDRLITADLPGSGQPLTFDYYANDDLKHIVHGNGATTDYTYFPEGPVERITVQNSGGSQLLDLRYQLDATLNIDAILEAHEPGTGPYIYDYEYDGLDRLIGAQYPTAHGLPPSESFAYDPAGNREDPSDPDAYAYDANNRITASPGKTYTFDEDGSVSQIAGSTQTERFTFDKKNRLRTWTDGASSASYLYDPFGRRLRKSVNGVDTWFVWDGSHLLTEHGFNGARSVRYAYAGGFAPAESATTSYQGDTIRSVHTNHLDAPVLLVNSSGTRAWRTVYGVYGAVTIQEGSEADFRIKFPGQYADPETGRYYNRFRYYDPDIGRYINADPAGQDTQLQLFAYALNRPTFYVDPFGLDTRFYVFRSPAPYGVGSYYDHAAVEVDNGPNGRTLYDPAGHYDPRDFDKSGEPPRADRLFDETNGYDVDDYLDFHADPGGSDSVSIISFKTTPEQEAALIAAAAKKGGGCAMCCASNTARAAQSSGAFPDLEGDFALPGSLKEALENQPNSSTTSIDLSSRRSKSKK